jgi:hypothetical protein
LQFFLFLVHYVAVARMGFSRLINTARYIRGCLTTYQSRTGRTIGWNRLLLDLLCDFAQILIGLVQQKLLVLVRFGLNGRLLELRGRRLLAA